MPVASSYRNRQSEQQQILQATGGPLFSLIHPSKKKHLHMIFSDGFSESFLIKKNSNSEWRGAARGLLILSAHPELFSEVCVPTKLEPDILGGSMAAPLVSVFQSTEDQWHDHSQGWCLNLCPSKRSTCNWWQCDWLWFYDVSCEIV